MDIETIDMMIRQLDQEVEDKKRKGDVVFSTENEPVVCEGGIVTNFPKNPPPPGIAYSKNFARFHKHGRFAVQVRD